MKNAWLKIEHWLALHHPALFETLNPGATNQELGDFELSIGTFLPEDFKQFWSIHNGQTRTHLRLLDGDFMLSISDIQSEWQGWKEVLPVINANTLQEFGKNAESLPDRGIKSDWWNPLWIPFTADGSGDSYCVDLDPAEDGQIGQIIRMIHDDPQRELVALSFRQWIYNYIDDLESNRYEASNELGYGGIVRRYE